MAQDVGPILEMVTEKYLLRSESEWHGRQTAIQIYDEVVAQLKAGDVQAIGRITSYNVCYTKLLRVEVVCLIFMYIFSI